MNTPCIQWDKISELTTQQALNNQSLATMNDKLDSIETKLDKFIESAEGKYSGKWVEKAMIWIATMIGMSVMWWILALIFK